MKDAGVRRLLDIRLHNVSQLSGFAKAPDIAYFLRGICDIRYEHDTRLAPTEELLSAYRRTRGGWEAYERGFLALLRERNISAALDRDDFAEKTVLLCSEPRPDHCHRRLVAELLAASWGADVEHL